MNRIGLSCVVLTAMLAVGCGSSDGIGQSPTGPSAPTPPASTPTPPSNSCVPSTPQNFSVSIDGSTRLFTWSASPNAADYFIQIGSISGASDLVNTNTTHTDYNWKGAGPSTYFARVYARSSCGSSATSPELVLH